jgi:zinc-binding in reverse transcriptase
MASNYSFEKVKIYLWLVQRNRILTEENLIKKSWTENSKFVCCDAIETTNNLLNVLWPNQF